MIHVQVAVHRRADPVLVAETEDMAQLVGDDECPRVAVLPVLQSDVGVHDPPVHSLHERLACDLEPADADQNVGVPPRGLQELHVRAARVPRVRRCVD